MLLPLPPRHTSDDYSQNIGDTAILYIIEHSVQKESAIPYDFPHEVTRMKTQSDALGPK